MTSRVRTDSRDLFNELDDKPTANVHTLIPDQFGAAVSRVTTQLFSGELFLHEHF